MQLSPTAQAIEVSKMSAQKKESVEVRQPVLVKDVVKPEIKKQRFGDKRISITGVSERINLNGIATLWASFENKFMLHQRLLKQPEQVYVFYRNLSDDYRKADVTIGYDVSIVSPASEQVVIPAASYHKLLSKGAHSEQALAKAWQTIDYQQNNITVVEVHNLTTNTAEVFVTYQ